MKLDRLRKIILAALRLVPISVAGTIGLMVASSLLLGLAPLALRSGIDAATATFQTSTGGVAWTFGLSALLYAAMLGGARVCQAAFLPLFAGWPNRIRVVILYSGPTAFELLTIGTTLLLFFDVLTAFCYILFIALYGYVFHRSISQQQSAIRVATGIDQKLSNSLSDSLINFEAMKALQAEPARLHVLEQLGIERLSSWMSSYNIRASNSLKLAAIQFLFLGAVLGMAIVRLGQGQASPGDLVALVLYSAQITLPIERIVNMARELFVSHSHLRRLMELLEEPTESAKDTGMIELPRSEALALRFDSVVFSYEPERRVLNGLSFDIRAGSKVAIVGPSGSGKSSIARLFVRFYEPTSGSVLVNGIEAGLIRLASLRRAVTLVPQEPLLFSDTIRANIAVGMTGRNFERIDEAARATGLADVIRGLPNGWDTVVGERGSSLSAGERQKVGLTRALLRGAQVVILDEATSSLDLRSERWFLEQSAPAFANVTTLVIAHRLSSVAGCDEILVLDRGVLVERGTHAQLLALGGLYHSLWYSQSALSATLAPA